MLRGELSILDKTEQATIGVRSGQQYIKAITYEAERWKQLASLWRAKNINVVVCSAHPEDAFFRVLFDQGVWLLILCMVSNSPSGVWVEICAFVPLGIAVASGVAPEVMSVLSNHGGGHPVPLLWASEDDVALCDLSSVSVASIGGELFLAVQPGKAGLTGTVCTVLLCAPTDSQWDMYASWIRRLLHLLHQYRTTNGDVIAGGGVAEFMFHQHVRDLGLAPAIIPDDAAARSGAGIPGRMALKMACEVMARASATVPRQLLANALGDPTLDCISTRRAWAAVYRQCESAYSIRTPLADSTVTEPSARTPTVRQGVVIPPLRVVAVSASSNASSASNDAKVDETGLWRLTCPEAYGVIELADAKQAAFSTLAHLLAVLLRIDFVVAVRTRHIKASSPHRAVQ